MSAPQTQHHLSCSEQFHAASLKKTLAVKKSEDSRITSFCKIDEQKI